jgi:hypothetical protein
MEYYSIKAAEVRPDTDNHATREAIQKRLLMKTDGGKLYFQARSSAKRSGEPLSQIELDIPDEERVLIADELKKIGMTLFGTINQTVVYKWGFDYETGSQAQPSVITDTSAPAEYNIAEYGVSEYSRNLIVTTPSVNAGGVGKVVQIGFECQLQGYPISIQRVDVVTKEAAYK